VNDATDHAAVINPVCSATPTRQQGLDPPPFSVRQPIKRFLHPGLLESEETLNHDSERVGILIEYRP
jgi:hypothetical protein